MSTRKKLKRNCRFSLVCGSEKGLMVKSRASWPTLRYEPPKMVVSDWKLPPISKMKVRGAYFCAFWSKKLQKYDLPLRLIPRITVWATSPVCRLSRFHNRVVIFCEGYVRAVRFEEVLVNMEPCAKRFERRLQPLHRVLLFRAVKTFVVHAGNTEDHAEIAALRKEGSLFQKP